MLRRPLPRCAGRKKPMGPQAALFLLNSSLPGPGAGGRRPDLDRSNACRACRADRTSVRDAGGGDARSAHNHPVRRSCARRTAAGASKNPQHTLSETVAAHAHGLVVHDGVCSTPRLIGSPRWARWALLPTATAQAARMHARTGNHGKELVASTRSALAGQQMRNTNAGS